MSEWHYVTNVLHEISALKRHQPQAIAIAFLVALGARPAALAQFDVWSDIPPSSINTYLESLNSAIKSEWQPGSRQSALPAVVTFNVDDTGIVNTVRLKQSSGDRLLDEAALNAVEGAAPFDSLPITRKSITVEYTFNTLPDKNPAQPPVVSTKKTNFKNTPVNAGDSAFGAYTARLNSKIKSNWKPINGPFSSRVDVTFKIHPDGTFGPPKVSKSSRLNDIDQAALQAVAESSPFEPLPHTIKHDTDVTYTFEDLADPTKVRRFYLSTTVPLPSAGIPKKASEWEKESPQTTDQE